MGYNYFLEELTENRRKPESPWADGIIFVLPSLRREEEEGEQGRQEKGFPYGKRTAVKMLEANLSPEAKPFPGVWLCSFPPPSFPFPARHLLRGATTMSPLCVSSPFCVSPHPARPQAPAAPRLFACSGAGTGTLTRVIFIFFSFNSFCLFPRSLPRGGTGGGKLLCARSSASLPPNSGLRLLARGCCRPPRGPEHPRVPPAGRPGGTRCRHPSGTHYWDPLLLWEGAEIEATPSKVKIKRAFASLSTDLNATGGPFARRHPLSAKEPK